MATRARRLLLEAARSDRTFDASLERVVPLLQERRRQRLCPVQGEVG